MTFLQTFCISLQQDAFRIPTVFLCIFLIFFIFFQEKVSFSKERKSTSDNFFFFSTLVGFIGLIFCFLVELKLSNS